MRQTSFRRLRGLTGNHFRIVKGASTFLIAMGLMSITGLGLVGCATSSTEDFRSKEISSANASDPWSGTVESEMQGRNRPVVGTRGMVAADDRIAAEWGAEIMRQGGNAIDAAVATGFAMAVTRPHYASLGGGGFLVYCPVKAECIVIDYREEAPGKAHRDMYVREGKARTDLSQDGALASGVPGVTAGLLLAHAKYGKLPRAKLLSRAIGLAQKGVPMSGHMEAAAEDRWGAMNDAGKSILGCSVQGKKQPCPVGTVLRQPDLAKVLREISTKGASGFYSGWVAQKMAQGIQSGGGIITEADLKSYAPRVRKPMLGQYRGWEVVTMPPPSAGGSIILQMFKYVELADRASAFDSGPGSVATTHALAHGLSLAFADRATHFGDPDFVKVPIDALLSPSYLEKRWKDTYRAGAANLPAVEGQFLPSEGSSSGTGMNTTHFSVIDAAGNAVAITTTVNDNYGSAFVPPGTGVFMNNEMDDFSIQPGTPNLYGLIGAEANAIAPKKRPLSSMSPTIIRGSDGVPRIAIGAQGGPRITTSVFLALFNRLRFWLSIVDSVHQPRFHHQWRPVTLSLEKNGFAPEVQTRLQDMGWVTKEVDTSGKMHAIERFPNGRTWGVSDPRTEGAAVAE